MNKYSKRTFIKQSFKYEFVLEKVMTEKEVAKAIERLEQDEIHILESLEEARKREDRIDKERLNKIKHFSMGDFAQTIIGSTIFSMAAIINTSFWEYLPNVKTKFLFFFHIVIMVCFMIALNYEYRDSMNYDKVFLKRLFKRGFYVYFSSMMMITLLLVLVNKINLNLANVDVARNYLAAMSMGLVGSVTFSFLKK